MLLDNIKIRTKIVCVISLMAIVSLAGLAFVSLQFKQADTQYSRFIAADTAAATLSAHATANLAQMGLQLANASLLFDLGSEEYKNAMERYEANRSEIRERLQTIAELVPAIAANVENIRAPLDQVDRLDRQTITLVQNRKKTEAAAIMKQRGNIARSLLPQFTAMTHELTKNVDDGSNELSDRTDNTILYSLLGLGLAVLGVIVLGLYVSARGITGPIERLRGRMLSLAGGETQAEIAGLGRKDEVGEMAQAVSVFRDNALERIRLEREAEANRSLSEKERIEREAQRAREAEEVRFAVDNLAAGLSKLSDGDVSYRIAQPFAATLDAVRNDFNASAEKLQSALSRVAENARGIDAGANEIKSAADDLARRTEQQAAAVEETAAALEQITTTVKDSTRRAQEAGQLVSRTRSGAEQSGEVVRRAVVAMERIEKSSSEISNIIGVIDEIAFQTNLLALNAGVEAARAGDAGKGFAVVAQEVRELAQRSANAAKEIKALITASSEQVQEGVQLVGDTGKALETIVAEVQEINRHVAAIVESAQEQSSGLQQINTAVNQMDQDTQKNAAMVEETTAATHSLTKEVASLNALLTLFRLSSGAPQAAAPVRRATGGEAPAPSPVRALGRKIAGAFAGNAAVRKDEWEEF
ncbi:HAMP domain-containing methyl-accepting chemotaxis protein [Rhizobiaceae bacterium BDR2-2]|uniref:HAMP domain-containing methyl-accepting chemotaxis protein n=2 Tax=Ectorhizobium quercum TaxID=2965071 RepID=A0AAE3N0H7_9HYPH|nr:HAMP domain-containing methyl-accepting chemotaxis protein [Ectorhizobium quercum]MCX8997469.1 HAMP domain-containing methyl-accepting chemotaxis protein [Ectorhizobium quercum]